MSPTGGPASGPFSNSASVPSPAAPVPSPSPLPPPVCVTADILSDCFVGLVGTIPPGSVGGWSFEQSFGPKGGQVSFGSDQMSFDMLAINNAPGAKKSIALASVNNITAQYEFTEFPTPTGLGNSFYEFYIVNADLSEAVFIRFVDDGSFFVGAGSTSTGNSYFGTWTPNNGTHKVHLTVDGSGNPTLWLDGVALPITLNGPFGFFLGSMPANVVVFFAGAGLSFPVSSPVLDAFVATGNFAPTQEFCCP